MSPSPQRCPCPNTWNPWMHYLTWQRGMKAADGTKVTNQMSLNWENYPGLSEWDQYNHKGFEKWGKQLQERVRVMRREKKLTSPLLAVKWEKSVTSQGEQAASRSWKRQGKGSYTELTKKNASVSWAWRDPCQTSDPHNYRVIHLCYSHHYV